MNISGTGAATGKIILIGEHAVVYNQPAIAFPFSGATVKATITQSQSNTDSLQTTAYQGTIETLPTDLQTIKQLTNRLKKDLHTSAFNLIIESSIPAERGMGSSAALAVAITRAFFDWQAKTLTDDCLLEYVNFSETIAHGNPSGIDAATTSGKHSIYFEKGKDWESFPLNVDAFLLVADTGIKGQTRQAVQSVADLLKENPHETMKMVQTLGSLTKEAKNAIIHNEPITLGGIMTNAHMHLQSLKVSNYDLDTYVQCALDHGALGAKLTGGGRGGCLIVLTHSKEKANEISNHLLKLGVANTWIQGLGVYQNV